MNLGLCCVRIAVLPLLLAVGLSGCGGGGISGAKGTVSGKVTVDGAPLAKGTIIFVGENNGDTASAILNSDGTYALKYGDGFSIPAGDYRVAFTASNAGETPPDPMALMDNPEKYKPNTQIPAKYLDSKTSGLVSVVNAGSNSDVNFDLKTN